MVVMQVGEQHDVRGSLSQQSRCWVWTVPLQEQHSISQDWIGKHPKLADVYQDCGVSDIVYLSQLFSLFCRIVISRSGTREKRATGHSSLPLIEC